MAATNACIFASTCAESHVEGGTKISVAAWCVRRLNSVRGGATWLPLPAEVALGTAAGVA
eukprot:CAMPEP_0179347084 /NCGR_PEP_ID=MMETSP0797-20121207/72924_1 /TAXON_ID=47934 /ORGANISM="Dinophysis acuminata, Strain DAEP01" /LENGTH=59 /DNA_ID=CAMNT_0021061687 /DNA_START=110 /DNA_END=289 /DNA_ORIENTATION=-